MEVWLVGSLRELLKLTIGREGKAGARVSAGTTHVAIHHGAATPFVALKAGGWRDSLRRVSQSSGRAPRAKSTLRICEWEPRVAVACRGRCFEVARGPEDVSKAGEARRVRSRGLRPADNSPYVLRPRRRADRENAPGPVKL
jgi:hypothetical protein